MKLLDLFSGAGGCSVGYSRAGFEVTGVDVEFHEAYPDSSLSLWGASPDDCEFVLADALEVLHETSYLDRFDVVHASPPCQAYSTITPDTSGHPDLIGPVRELLEAWGGPYVIENVEGARPILRDPVRLCGSAFGLRVRRHRLFESNVPLLGVECDHARQGVPVGVYGDLSGTVTRPNGTSRGIKPRDLAEARSAMGIDWMPWADLVDAVPPAFTEHLGRQLIHALEGVPA